MDTRIRGIYPSLSSFKMVDIFGYSTKGIPGIEIIGLGHLNKTIKEKFVYLTRMQTLQIPKRRYVLCVESFEGKREKDSNFRFLEFPMLVLFWSLSGHLPISRLEDCFACGKIYVSGEIHCLDLSDNFFSSFQNNDLKYIVPGFANCSENICQIDAAELFEGKNYLKFSLSKH